MKLQVIGAGVWQEELTTQRKHLRAPELGNVLLQLCHSSGLPAPPEVVFRFASWLSGRGFDPSDWDNMLPDRMRARAGTSLAQAIQSLAEEPFHAARLLLFPVCDLVCAQHETGFLFAATGRRRSIAREQHIFVQRVGHLLTARTVEAQAQRKAISLRAFQFLEGKERQAPSSAHHLPDAWAAALFLAAARRDQGRTQAERSEPDPTEANTRISHRLQSDGIEGIRHASPTEDPSLMVPSQLVYPAPVMIEKIANEGFTAYDRPPPLRERHRYLFAVSVLGVSDGPLLSVARAGFWLAARHVETEFATTPADLSFAWRPAEAGRYDVVHRATVRSRAAAAAGSPAAWLQAFEGEAAPFRTGPAYFAGGPAPAVPDAETLLLPVLDPAEEEDVRQLRVHLTLLSTAGRATVEARDRAGQMLSFGADICAGAQLILDAANGGSLILDGYVVRHKEDGLVHEVATVRTLAACWRASFKEVIDRG